MYYPRDNTFTSAAGVAYGKPTNASASKVLTWTLPSLMDGLNVVTSYNMSTAGEEATIGYALTYTGVEGLSVSYGAGEKGSTTAGTGGIEQTTMKASFAFGPVTAAMSINDYDKTGVANEEQSSYKISYSVSDDLSISYGSETHETVSQGYDEEFSQVSVSYTSGGLTATVSETDAENVGGSGREQSKWNVGLSFAF
jgi:outer membrane protein OmpU